MSSSRCCSRALALVISRRSASLGPEVVDTTGAGDAFTAGLLHRWSAPPTERVRFAAACGALVCAGAGGIDPQPTEIQVEAFLGGVS